MFHGSCPEKLRSERERLGGSSVITCWRLCPSTNPWKLPMADHVTKEALVAHTSERLMGLHVEKLKALAIFIEA